MIASAPNILGHRIATADGRAYLAEIRRRHLPFAIGIALRSPRLTGSLVLSVCVAFATLASIGCKHAKAAEISIVQLRKVDGANNGYRSDLQDYSPGSNLSDDTQILCNIRLSGDIRAGDRDKLAAILTSAPQDESVRLCLNSRGGDYAEALGIAEMLLDRSVGTAVEANSVCYSSCAIMFMSGTANAGFYKLNMFLHVTGKLGFHAPYIGEMPEGAYDAKTIQNTFTSAVAAISKLMKLDTNRFSALFLTNMLEKGPTETFDIDTVGKVVENRISLYGGTAPSRPTAKNFCYACFYDLDATSECQMDATSKEIPGGIQYIVDTFRGGECVVEARTQNSRVTGWRLGKYTDVAATLPYWYLYSANTPISRLALATRQNGATALSVQPPKATYPSYPNEPITSLNDRIARFIEDEYLRDIEHFAPQVDYYDKGVVGYDFIAKDRATYARKWPQRQYQMIPGSLRVSSRSPNEYSVTFEFTFLVANGSKRKSGRGATQVILQESNGLFLVVGVKEVVRK